MTRVLAGHSTAFVVGSVYPIALPRDPFGRPREALLLRGSDGELRAYLNRCRHLPIPLDAGARRFLTHDGAHLQCVTHGARYRPDDGHCVFGPCAGAALERFALEVEADAVYIVVPS